jgi:hypothetical protein
MRYPCRFTELKELAENVSNLDRVLRTIFAQRWKTFDRCLPNL